MTNTHDHAGAVASHGSAPRSASHGPELVAQDHRVQKDDRGGLAAGECYTGHIFSTMDTTDRSVATSLFEH